MSNTGLTILLLSLSFFVVMGLNATSNLLDTAKLSNDSSTLQASQGAQSTLSPLWVVLIICVLLIASYALIYAFSSM